MATNSDRLAILSNAEQFALYGLPDFDDGQRLGYLSPSEAELTLACGRSGLHAQVYCALQIGYFKAKRAFFSFTWDDIQDDSAFVLSRYFNGYTLEPHTITKHEHFAQRTLIAELFNYQLWSADFLQQLSSIWKRSPCSMSKPKTCFDNLPRARDLKASPAELLPMRGGEFSTLVLRSQVSQSAYEMLIIGRKGRFSFGTPQFGCCLCPSPKKSITGATSLSRTAETVVRLS
jgi:hypothetical protein